MNPQEYYSRVIDLLENCFQFSHYVLGKEDGNFHSPAAVAEPVSELRRLTVEQGMEVAVPLVGEQSQSVLMPLDIRIFIAANGQEILADKKKQKEYFALLTPCLRYVENLFRERAMPYLLDYTPAGGRILFQNPLGYRSAKEVRDIGFVEKDLVKACSYIDFYDIRRWYGISHEAASLFSGLGRLAEYTALLAMQEFRDNAAGGLLPVAISGSLDRCISVDNTWAEGSPFLQAVTSPLSLYRGNPGESCRQVMPAVMGSYFDGRTRVGTEDLDTILDCMWDLEKAAGHARRFSGYVPCANETLIDFVNEYRASDLYLFHRDFDRQDDMPCGRAIQRALEQQHLPDWTKQVLLSPNPAALQPKNITGLVYDFLIHAQWQPKHIANILRDLYQDPSHRWTQNFFRHPAEEKANFWARTYSAVALWKTGRLSV
jgi:hypothetical protein